jgi:hypothetical protein
VDVGIVPEGGGGDAVSPQPLYAGDGAGGTAGMAEKLHSQRPFSKQCQLTVSILQHSLAVFNEEKTHRNAFLKVVLAKVRHVSLEW